MRHLEMENPNLRGLCTCMDPFRLSYSARIKRLWITVFIISTNVSGWVLGLWRMHTELTCSNTALRSHVVKWTQIRPASDSRNIQFEVISQRNVYDSAYFVHVLSFSKPVAPVCRINDIKLLNIVLPNIDTDIFVNCSWDDTWWQ
jgi:hypothetical protein